VLFCPVAERDTVRCDVLVNATSVGMYPGIDESPVAGRRFGKSFVFDAVYNPAMTKLLREAKAAGATVIPGTEMYLNQAALQSRLYTGVAPNAALMRRLLAKLYPADRPSR
jgi:shikimate 5-dehydrogenase